MKELHLLRLSAESGLGAFTQYIPENMRREALLPRSLCVGLVYDGLACGGALITEEAGEPYLRWIMTDPQTRYCGAGTYLLRGILGLAGGLYGGADVLCALTSDLTEAGRVSGIFHRAGFSAAEPFANEFAAPLSSFVLPPPAEGLTVLPLSALWDEYECWLADGVLPDFMDTGRLGQPMEQLCLGCVREGALAGVLLCEEQEGDIFLRGLYTAPAHRRRGVGRTLAYEALLRARQSCPPTTRVVGTAVSEESFALCLHAFGQRAARRTPLVMRYTFDGSAGGGKR